MTILWQEKGEIQKPLKQRNEPLESRDGALTRRLDNKGKIIMLLKTMLLG